MTCNLMKDCLTIPLVELLEFIVDNRGKTVPTGEGTHILIATNCIKNTELYPVFEKVRYLDDNTYNTWFRSHPEPGDIIFVNKGTPGRVCMVPNPVNFCIAQDMIALRVKKEFVYNKYLFAVLRSPAIQKQIYNTNVGDVIPHFKKSFLDQLFIPVPKMNIQKRIGDIYFELSEKIDLNNRINKKLEAQAQSIFNEWFFGKDMQNDWGTLGEIADINPLRKLTKGTVAKYIEMSNLATTNAFPLGWEEKPYKGGAKFKNGDTLLARITPCLENGKGAYVNFLEENEIAFGSTEYIIISGKNGYCDELFYFLTRYLDFQLYAAKSMTGSSGRQRVSAESIANYEMPIPSMDLSERFHEIAGPIMTSNCIRSLENRILSAIRDTLLPKLMSGEIQVPKEV